VPWSNPSGLLPIYEYVPFPTHVRPQLNANLTTFDTIQDVFDISSAQSTTIKEGIHFQPDADVIAIGKKTKGDRDIFYRNVSRHRKVSIIYASSVSF
jgi:hypothetical protein